MASAVWPWLVGLLLVSLGTCVFGAENATTSGKPLSIPPSQFWDGKDGPWSTFRIEVGTPPQQIRVLPASDQSSTLLVLPEACSSDEGQSCAENHGDLYMRNTTSTWEEYGQYELNTYLERRVGLDGAGLYGWDKLSLGWTGDGMPSLDNQSVAGIISPDFYLGSLALNPRPINFTDYNNPISSLLQNLKNMSEQPIPSLSWSYTAGAHNLAPKVFGSLILGGYDSTRFEPNQVVFPFGSDISFDFQVAIQRVTTNVSNEELLSAGIIAFISTLVADIWLPTNVCKRFEDAFGLVWDNQTELYLMDDALHESLLEKNPVVSFQIGPQIASTPVTINMPYWNFYQTATTALTGNSSSMYFPLKRAANDTQYVLGRTFLQSAYLSADYERNTFNLSQATYPSSSTQGNIVAILPPLEETSPGEGNSSSGSSSGSGLGTGAIAGIAVGGAVLLAVIATIVFIWYRRKQKAKSAEAHELEDTDASKNIRHEVAADGIKHEVGDGLRHEVAGDSDHKVELYAGAEHQKPVEADGSQFAIYEMPAEEIKVAEMEGEGHVTKSPEMAAVRHATAAPDVVEVRDDDREPLTPPFGRSSGRWYRRG